MINLLTIHISDNNECISEKLRLKLNEDLSVTEDHKLQLIKNIISSVTSATVDVQLIIACSNTRELSFVHLAEKIKDLNNVIRQKTIVDSLLSKREKEILFLILKGLTSREISERLFICLDTVKSHRKKILEKTGSRNTASLVKLFAASDPSH
ncbi:MAG TPA: helix-turn-helix transcriptional regulator [Parafilimonas sp.]|nr:helix-turn-helix transcriptional regulator [Parafilimonas sp.]